MKECKKYNKNASLWACLTCSVRLLLSSVWIHALRVSSVMKIWAALANRTGASALIICTYEMELQLVRNTHRLSNIRHIPAILWMTHESCWCICLKKKTLTTTNNKNNNTVSTWNIYQPEQCCLAGEHYSPKQSFSFHCSCTALPSNLCFCLTIVPNYASSVGKSLVCRPLVENCFKLHFFTSSGTQFTNRN